MSSVATSLPQSSVSSRRHDETLLAVGAELKTWFGTEFAFWSRESGELVHAGDDLPWSRGALGDLVGGRATDLSQPQVLAEFDCFALVALPLEDERRRRRLAAAPVATRHPMTLDEVQGDAVWLEVSAEEAFRWLRKLTATPADALLRISQAVSAKIDAEGKARRLEQEVAKISDNLASTYEEISLLYDITQNLRISSTDEQLGERALDWLAECLPAQNLVLYLAPVAKESEITYRARTEPLMLTRGQPVIEIEQLERLVEHLDLGPGSGPLVANRNVTSTSRWKFKAIRELIVAPLGEGERVFGWLAAFNHGDGKEFGTIEASLLNSVSAILGIHGCNIDLYRQQNEFLASVVRAFTSAIDAKDPYTCGHSDRVARVSVRLAQELGCDTDTAHTIYMAGLVHDIGKIGIADSVLRKPGRLTEAEFEHIKLHPELGYKILCDIKQLADVLPVVLHHHEQWDGRGYPHGLAGEAIPYLARICAVADAYDAMSSDRPYRKGMPEEKVVSIFTEGAGSQWDREVVNAFFRALDDIREISQRERAGLSLDVQRWAKLPGSPFYVGERGA
jgi:HD-GYP domain-containing protein (c-di-GMP phosphodiesterase class II)